MTDTEPDSELWILITKVGRWRYRLQLKHGLHSLDEWGTWHAWGLNRATRKAHRRLDAYRDRTRPALDVESWKVHGGRR